MIDGKGSKALSLPYKDSDFQTNFDVAPYSYLEYINF